MLNTTENENTKSNKSICSGFQKSRVVIRRALFGVGISALSGCLSVEAGPGESQITNILQPKAVDFKSLTIAEEISARQAEYALAESEIHTRSVLGGAVKGALLGLVLDAEPIAVVGGAAFGAVIGHKVGERIASQVVQEHKNFSLRKASLDRLLEAAKIDTDNTYFDLSLARRFQDAERSSGDSKSIVTLNKFYVRALERKVALAELADMYEGEGDRSKIQIKAEQQEAMILEFERILKALVA